ncbi:Uncharacterised protein [Pasteurella canis]|uniref:Lipoprotein n=1 Tax=Pasteurella canis TaxID=753 RepID=A0A379ETD2_9PAST|nr:hypothetical protein [Pasteurella canis]SUC09665.1 Uncharacterised protein [Pasteurella canis]
MKKNIMMIIMSLIISGCAIGGSVNAGGGSSGIGVGIGIGTGVRF